MFIHIISVRLKYCTLSRSKKYIPGWQKPCNAIRQDYIICQTRRYTNSISIYTIFSIVSVLPSCLKKSKPTTNHFVVLEWYILMKLYHLQMLLVPNNKKFNLFI